MTKDNNVRLYLSTLLKQQHNGKMESHAYQEALVVKHYDKVTKDKHHQRWPLHTHPITCGSGHAISYA